ncbi:LysR family transcriptional regulator [Paraglaciecola marina]|uniref:LysR family transcriptional regulator n=1 Tax=Paraglaciecola marina TaxID=2500157 RepID=UPI00105E985F|nr:LysR family transcriptional regulator [Paraglaciecola marina]
MTNLNYQHLLYFYITAKEGSIARASKVLHLTAQTISSQISVLEDTCGFQLFDRIGKRLVLNEKGKLTYTFADDIFKLGNELQHTLKNQYQTSQHIFTVGITDALPKVLAFDLFRSCFENDLNTHLICKEGDLDSLMTELAVNKLDIILSDRPMLPGVHVKAFNHVIGEGGLTFLASANLAESLKDNFPQSLHHQPFLISGEKSVQRLNLLTWFDSLGIQPIIKAEFEDSALTKLFGQAGYGVFCAPTSIEQHLMEHYDVSIVGRTKDIKENLYLISPERKLKHPAVVPLFEHAKTIVQAK